MERFLSARVETKPSPIVRGVADGQDDKTTVAAPAAVNESIPPRSRTSEALSDDRGEDVANEQGRDDADDDGRDAGGFDDSDHALRSGGARSEDSESAHPSKLDDDASEVGGDATWSDRLGILKRHLQFGWVRLRANPMAVAALLVGLVWVVFVAAKPAARPMSQGVLAAQAQPTFPDVDFRESRKEPITDNDVAAIMARARGRNGHDTVAAVAASSAGVPSQAGAVPGERLYSADEVASAIATAQRMAQEQQQKPRKRGRLSAQRKLTDPPTSDVPFPNGARAQRVSRSIEADSTTASAFDDPNDFDTRMLGSPGGGGGSVGSSSGGSSRDSSAADKVRLPVGARISAVLDVGVSSVRHGVVLARTTASVTTLGGQVLPAGTVLRGSSSSGRDRVFLEFTRIMLGERSVAMQGLAVVGEQMGVPAMVRQETFDNRAQSRVADGALEALKGVTAAMGGPIGQGLTRGSDGALSEAQRDIAIDRSVVLEVSAGTRFEIVVTDG